MTKIRIVACHRLRWVTLIIGILSIFGVSEGCSREPVAEEASTPEPTQASNPDPSTSSASPSDVSSSDSDISSSDVSSSGSGTSSSSGSQPCSPGISLSPCLPVPESPPYHPPPQPIVARPIAPPPIARAVSQPSKAPSAFIHLTVVNDTERTIQNLYVRCQNDVSWGEDRLGAQEIIAVGGTVEKDVAACTADLKVKSQDHSTCVIRNLLLTFDQSMHITTELCY